MIRRFIIIALYNIFWLTSLGQSPAYIRIGENELSGVDIYGITQDQDRNIWLNSNRGVIRYDGYEFKFLSADHLKSMSAFGITENGKGEIFCFNLFGQILKVEEDTIKIHLQLPDSLVFNRYEMDLMGDSILLRSDKNILITPDKEISIIEKEYPERAYNSIFKASMPCYKINEAENTKTIFIPNLFTLYKWNGKEYVEQRMKRDHIPLLSVSHAIYRTRDDEYFFTLRNEGIYAFDANGNPLYNSELLFPNYKVSGFLEDYEGNLWVTTLGKGILLVVDKNIISYKDHYLFQGKNVSTLKYRSDGTLFLGTETGEIFSIGTDGRINEVFSNGAVNIHFVEFLDNKILSNGAATVELIDLKDNISVSVGQLSAVKESFQIGKREYIFATSNGVYRNKITDKNKFEQIKYFRVGRSNAIIRIGNSFKYLVGTVKGVFEIGGEETKEIKKDGNKIISSGFVQWKEKVFISTTTDGIHILEKGEFTGQINSKNGLMGNRVQKIQNSGKYLGIITSEGIQLYDIEKDEFVELYIDNLINGSRILNFAFYKDRIFVVTNRDLLSFSINRLEKEGTPPHISFTKILVNEIEYELDQNREFRYDQDKFEFEFTSRSFGHNGKLTYEYRLLPVDEYWEGSDFSNNKVKFASLKPGKYTFQVKAINQRGIESEVIEYHFIISKPYWETWWFYTISILLVATAITLVWFYQLKRIRKKNLQEQELIGSKLTALKLQMNPHFIFNALNSIQDLILQQDTDNSYDYIVKFSNLVRMTLNYSDKDMILIEEEIELLKLYLELENLRFTKDFHFSIDNQIERDIRIPSMLLQPFVENSIKHGLLHRDGEKNISIKFTLEDAVVCTIEDNGIGMEKSKEINKRKRKNHESISVKSIRRRIDILKEVYSSELGVEYVNLYDEKQNPAGTKVIIRIPFEDE